MKVTCKLCFKNYIDIIEDKQMQNIYYHCKDCDFIFSSKLPTIKQEQKQYSHHNNSLENSGYVEMFEKFIDTAITPYTNISEQILDYGSGPEPVLSYLLNKRGFNVQIYDPIYAKDESFKDKKFSTIVSTEVFEHLHSPHETIKELVEQLDDGAILSFQTMFHPEDNEKFLNWWYRRDPTHVGFFSHKTVEKMQDIFKLTLLKIDDKNIAVFRKN